MCVDPTIPEITTTTTIKNAKEDEKSKKTPTITPAKRRYVTVPEGHIWVTGDNLSASRDSRNYGPVPLGLVKGTVYYKVWPRQQRIVNAFDEAPSIEAGTKAY